MSCSIIYAIMQFKIIDLFQQKPSMQIWEEGIKLRSAKMPPIVVKHQNKYDYIKRIRRFYKHERSALW